MTRAGEKTNQWTEEEEDVLLSNPGMTARELSALLPGRSVKAVRQKRARLGRWAQGAARLCIRCDERPVYAESPRARRWGLCRGCYLDERQRRVEESRRDAAIRQKERTARRGGATR